jgi:hypothetical protein
MVWSVGSICLVKAGFVNLIKGLSDLGQLMPRVGAKRYKDRGNIVPVIRKVLLPVPGRLHMMSCMQRLLGGKVYRA